MLESNESFYIMKDNYKLHDVFDDFIEALEEGRKLTETYSIIRMSDKTVLAKNIDKAGI